MLKENKKQYEEQYVAFKSFSDREVISHGINPEKVLKDAKEKGFESPVLFFVPKKDTYFFY